MAPASATARWASACPTAGLMAHCAQPPRVRGAFGCEDFYQTEWPRRTRAYEYGVYTDQGCRTSSCRACTCSPTCREHKPATKQSMQKGSERLILPVLSHQQARARACEAIKGQTSPETTIREQTGRGPISQGGSGGHVHSPGPHFATCSAPCGPGPYRKSGWMPRSRGSGRLAGRA